MAPLQPETARRRHQRRRDDESLDGGSPEQSVPFGNYLLLGQLGRGGMAEIYLARSSTGVPPHLLAIKCMRSSLAQESHFVEMFIREGKLAMMLDHPSIVRTFDVGYVDDRYFISMDYIGGKDLNHLLRQCQETGRRIPIPHALCIALRTCQALHYAHSLCSAQGRPLNIVNRDVSPSNIRVTYEGEVKLLDFGIAQAVLQVTSEIGILKGKFAYMSPEQIRGLPLDHRTDIFSTGIVLHEMLTCERLFRDESEFVLMEMVRQAEIKPPSAYNPRVPPTLDRIVMRALDRDPNLRYPDAETFAVDLSQLLKDYQFSPAELGELVRGLFPADFRHDQAVEAACLAAMRKDLSRDPQTPSPLTTPRFRQHRKRMDKNRHKPAPTGSSKNIIIWVAALALLGAGIVILVVALI